MRQCFVSGVRLEIIVLIWWCAVTGSRQFLQPDLGKATTNSLAQSMIVIMCPARLVLLMLMGTCVFQPNQPQKVDAEHDMRQHCAVQMVKTYDQLDSDRMSGLP
jgi:hypothetical protein